jgi:beta-lactam-binding protein with PASTA domain
MRGRPAAGRRPRQVPLPQTWLPGVLLALLGALLIVAGVNHYLNPPEFTLPDLRSLTAREALEKVNSMGLKVVFNEAGDPQKPRDVIIEQNPAPGARVKPRHRLELLINRPKEGVVPDLTGEPLDEAQQQLAAGGFQPAEIETAPSDRPAGTVLATAPPAKAPLPQGAQIKLLVSEGPGQQTTVLPDLQGLALKDAEYLLSVAELRVGDIQHIPSPEPLDTILAQSPPPGSELSVGSPVTLTVAARAEVLIPKNTILEPETPPPAEQPEASGGASDSAGDGGELAPGERIVPIRVTLPRQSERATVHVRLVVSDENGNRTPIDTYAPVGTALEGSVRVRGDAHFRLYLDDFLYQQWDSPAP